MKPLLAATALAIAAAAPALAETRSLEAAGSVGETVDRLEAAAKEAGATIFARIDHAGGAAEAGLELAPAELLIFGNPKMGTPAMRDDPRAGLVLPLRVLVHESDGRTLLTWETPESLFDGLEIPQGAAYRAAIAEALDKLTAAAAGD